MVADTTTLKHPSQKPSIKPDSLKPSAKSDARSKKRKGKATRTTPREPQNEDTSSKVNEMDLLFDTLHTNKKKKKERDAIKSIEVKLEHKRMKKEKEKLKEHIQALETNNKNMTALGNASNPSANPIRYDHDGLPIYSEESLQINRGGNTNECPFDCWCCF
uniref:Uncharacterized protein AlNc14C86G5505 n=1 Tax=Albugo laibachii Nc14 TaxID=890382 RepID=F0WFX0_9STRA|nr:conserved hypothetical protein [Albugo laibachii Nc14]|eukprot:CCA20104.1 conserved hypothetical protein [Albugo laibachii Nc14]